MNTTDSTPPPFESAVTVPLDKQVNLTQLADEIGKATGRVVHLAINTTPGPDGVLTSVLSVSPGTVAEDKVVAAVEAHEPVADYGVSAAEKTFRDVLIRAREEDDPVLDTDELHAAVVGLLRRVGPN